MPHNIWGEWVNSKRDSSGVRVVTSKRSVEDRVFSLAMVLTLTVAQVEDYFQLTMSRDDD